MDSDEFSTSPVPAERSIPWGKIAVTNVLFSICLPTLITGLDLAIAAPRRYFLSGIIVGSLVLTFIGMLTSVLGTSAAAVRCAWTDSGSAPAREPLFTATRISTGRATSS